MCAVFCAGLCAPAWALACAADGLRGFACVRACVCAAGVDVVLCADSHLCCGSAGAYSVLHPNIAHELRDRKLANLEATGAKEIVSANVGCITHLQSGTATPVTHWIELIDRALSGAPAQ